LPAHVMESVAEIKESNQFLNLLHQFHWWADVEHKVPRYADKNLENYKTISKSMKKINNFLIFSKYIDQHSFFLWLHFYNDILKRQLFETSDTL
jgi:hypothetical protein